MNTISSVTQIESKLRERTTMEVVLYILCMVLAIIQMAMLLFCALKSKESVTTSDLGSSPTIISTINKKIAVLCTVLFILAGCFFALNLMLLLKK